MRSKVKILLILVALSFGATQVFARFESLLFPEVQLFGLIAYGGFLAICLAGIFCAAFIPNNWLRWGFGLLISLAGIMVGTFERTVQDHMSYDAFISMINASASLHEAWGQHGGAILTGCVQALLLFLGIGLGRPDPAPRHGKKLAAIPVVSLMALIGILFVRGGDGARGLPASYTGSAYALLYAYERATAEIQPREPVALPVANSENSDGDIVLLVDESISGQYLDINHPAGVRSGLKDSNAGVAVHNFGLAASISHCSAAVNYTLRHGGTRDAYRRINGSKPSIWSYAKTAGMETIYIDAQRTGKIFDNLMDEEELRDIDQWVQFEAVPIQRRDHAAADALADFLNDGKRQFIYVNKIGAHFPIHDKYPDAYLHYKPALQRGRFLDISDTGDRDGFTGSQDSWVRYRNAYRNTLLWNVGAFFDRLLSQADLGDATLIYTSDHGQNLHERGGTGVVTHCSPDPQPEEGLVPLTVLTSPQSSQVSGANDWARAAAQGNNRSSHFQIFPTILGMMGYDQTAVKSIYGSSLFTSGDDPFSFNYQFNARLGRSPQWKKINLQEIAGPPVTDYIAASGSAPKKVAAAR